jgi:hypothetical protein
VWVLKCVLGHVLLIVLVVVGVECDASGVCLRLQLRAVLYSCCEASAAER